MVTEVRIYAEGGGDKKDTRALLREGFSRFLDSLRKMARSKGIRWNATSLQRGCSGQKKMKKSEKIMNLASATPAEHSYSDPLRRRRHHICITRSCSLWEFGRIFKRIYSIMKKVEGSPNEC